MAIFCMNCGTQVPDDSKFCLKCGQPPRGAAPATPNQGPGYTQPVVNTGPTYGDAYQGTPPQYTNPGYPASPQPPQQDVPQYAQNPQYSQYPQNPQYTQYPQSPQGAPFAPGVPPVQTAQKNRLPLYIVAAIVVVIVIVGGVTYFNNLNQSTPDKTLSAFCNDLQTGDYASSYNLLSSNFKKNGTQAQWDLELTAAFKLKKGISSCTTSNVSSSSSTAATGTMMLNYGDNSKETDKVSLVDENGTWKVDNITTQSQSQA